jgi:hypothetical protein
MPGILVLHVKLRLQKIPGSDAGLPPTKPRAVNDARVQRWLVDHTHQRQVWQQGGVGAPPARAGGGPRPRAAALGGLRNAVGSAETMPVPVALLSHWKAIETEICVPAGANT